MKIMFLSTLSYIHFRSQRKENGSGIPAYGIYGSVKRFLQPVKVLEISIMERSWNYFVSVQGSFHEYRVKNLSSSPSMSIESLLN